MKATFIPGILVFFAIAPGASAQSSLPEGPGQKLVELVCSKCHTTDRIASKAMTKAEWKEEVTEMLQEEDDVTEAEKDEIIEYLAKNFPAKADDDKAKAKEKELARGMSSGGPIVIVQCRPQDSRLRTLDVLDFHNSAKMPHQRVATIDIWNEALTRSLSTPSSGFCPVRNFPDDAVPGKGNQCST
jgi:cytochrome c5